VVKEKKQPLLNERGTTYKSFHNWLKPNQNLALPVLYVPTALNREADRLRVGWLNGEGFRESRTCSRDTYPESYITEHALVHDEKTIWFDLPRSRRCRMRAGYHAPLTNFACTCEETHNL